MYLYYNYTQISHYFFGITTEFNVSFVELFVNGPDVLLDTNPAYVDHKSLAEQIKQHSDIALKNNEAYMEVILDPRSGGYKDCVRVNN